MKKFPVAFANSGMSMISVLVAISILGIMAVMMRQAGTNMFKAAKLVALTGEEEDLRNLIRTRMNCAATKDKMSSTPAGKKMLLYKKNGTALLAVQGDEMKLEQWTIWVNGFNATKGEFDVWVKHPQLPSAKQLFKEVPLACK